MPHESGRFLYTNLSTPPSPPLSIATILRVCFCLFLLYEHALILVSPIVNGVISTGAGGAESKERVCELSYQKNPWAKNWWVLFLFFLLYLKFRLKRGGGKELFL